MSTFIECDLYYIVFIFKETTILFRPQTSFVSSKHMLSAHAPILYPCFVHRINLLHANGCEMRLPSGTSKHKSSERRRGHIRKFNIFKRVACKFTNYVGRTKTFWAYIIIYLLKIRAVGLTQQTQMRKYFNSVKCAIRFVQTRSNEWFKPFSDNSWLTWKNFYLLDNSIFRVNGRKWRHDCAHEKGAVCLACRRVVQWGSGLLVT